MAQNNEIISSRCPSCSKVVVFGGSGFLGSHVADTLVDAGYDVTVYDLKYSKYLRASQNIVVGDI